MAITIKKFGDLYVVEATSAFHEGWDWKSPVPMEIGDIVNKLLSIGYHQADIGDALYNVDSKLVGINDSADE